MFSSREKKRAWEREYRKLHPEKEALRRESAQRYYKKYPEKAREHARKSGLKTRHGITVEEYAALLEAQGGHCAICPATEPGGGRRYFAVDHDHVSGKLRALLCCNCNLMLGHAKDNPETLEKGAAYIRAHRSTV